MNVNPEVLLAKPAPFPLTAALAVPAQETACLFPHKRKGGGTDHFHTCAVCQVIRSATPDFAIHLLRDFGQTA